MILHLIRKNGKNKRPTGKKSGKIFKKGVPKNQNLVPFI